MPIYWQLKKGVLLLRLSEEATFFQLVSLQSVFHSKSRSLVLVCHLDDHFALLLLLLFPLGRRISFLGAFWWYYHLFNWLLLQQLRCFIWSSRNITFHSIKQAARSGRYLAFIMSLHDKFRFSFFQKLVVLLVRLNRLNWRQKSEIKSVISGDAKRPIRDLPCKSGRYSLLDQF